MDANVSELSQQCLLDDVPVSATVGEVVRVAPGADGRTTGRPWNCCPPEAPLLVVHNLLQEADLFDDLVALVFNTSSRLAIYAILPVNGADSDRAVSW